MKFKNLLKALTALIIFTQSYSAPQSKTVTCDINVLKNKKNIVPIAVVGGGPGGLSAAFYGARERFHTVLFEGPNLGGQLVDTNYVENWPGIEKELGLDIVEQIEKQAKEAGAIFVPESVTNIDLSSWPFRITTDKGTQVNALSVIIATGAQPRKLGIKGEDTYWGKGVASCTLCDAPFTKDEDVVIIGGGDTSLEFAFSLTPFAKSITILVRDSELNISARNKKRLKKFPDIKFLFNTAATAIRGDGKKVGEVDAIDTNSKKSKTFKTHWVFIAIGQSPNTAMLKGQLEYNKEGCIILPGKSQETTIPGIFASGRVSDSPYKTGIIASGESMKAAFDAIRFLEKIGFEESMEEKLAPQLYNYQQEKKEDKTTTKTNLIENVTTPEQLQALIKKSNQPILLELYSPSCPHCQAMEKVIATVAQELKEKITVAKVNTAQAEKLTQQFLVKSIPTFIMLVKGKEVERTKGQMSKEKLMAFIKRHL